MYYAMSNNKAFKNDKLGTHFDAYLQKKNCIKVNLTIKFERKRSVAEYSQNSKIKRTFSHKL